MSASRRAGSAPVGSPTAKVSPISCESVQNEGFQKQEVLPFRVSTHSVDSQNSMLGKIPRVRLIGLNGECVHSRVAGVASIGELRERVAESSEANPADVRLVYGNKELTVDSKLIVQFDGVPIEGEEGALEVVFQVIISPVNEDELEKGLARRLSVHSFEELKGRRSLNASYFKADSMQDMMAVCENPELGKQYHRVPGSICEFEELEELIMQGHFIQHLPSRIGRLSRLKVLIIGQNQIKSIPEGLCRLTKLEKVDMQQNMIAALPQGIGNLVNLTILNLECNMLSSLPDSLTSLVALESLNVNSNRLTNLPEDFSRLSSLTSLLIRGNRIERLPDRFWELPLVDFVYDINLVADHNREDFVACMPEKFHNDRACSGYVPRRTLWSCLCPWKRREETDPEELAERRQRSSQSGRMSSRASVTSISTTVSQNDILSAAMANSLQQQRSCESASTTASQNDPLSAARAGDVHGQMAALCTASMADQKTKTCRGGREQ